jgi:enamine deaminase RidA (YjgF/YER057c/UK114 family)
MADDESRIKFSNPSELHAPVGYSHVAEVPLKGKLVYISGQIALDKNGNLIGKGDFRAQTQQAFRNLQSALESVGGTMKDIIKLNYYIVDMSRMQELRAVRDTFLPDKEHRPTSTAVGVTQLALPDLLVEIEGVALIG